MKIKTNDSNLSIDIFNRDGFIILKIEYVSFKSESIILPESILQLHGFTNSMARNPEHMKETLQDKHTKACEANVEMAKLNNEKERCIEKLKSELEGYKEKYTDFANIILKYRELVKLIAPKESPNDYFVILESFVKNALAKERKSGWYVVLHKDWNKRKPLYYSKESNGWGDRYFTKEIEHQYDNSCFSYISPTPIDLGELFN